MENTTEEKFDKVKGMTVRELYDHITKHLTPQEALMKLLEGSVINYEHLKIDDKLKAVHPVLLISMAALDMGWQIAVEKDNEENTDHIRGLAVGTKEYMQKCFPPPQVITYPDLDRKLEMIDQMEKDREDIPEGYTLATLYLMEAEIINQNNPKLK